MLKFVFIFPFLQHLSLLYVKINFFFLTNFSFNIVQLLFVIYCIFNSSLKETSYHSIVYQYVLIHLCLFPSFSRTYQKPIIKAEHRYRSLIRPSTTNSWHNGRGVLLMNKNWRVYWSMAREHNPRELLRENPFIHSRLCIGRVSDSGGLSVMHAGSGQIIPVLLVVVVVIVGGGDRSTVTDRNVCR